MISDTPSNDFNTCQEKCGDGLIVGDEDCDEGLLLDPPLGCNLDCIGQIAGYDCHFSDGIEPTLCNTVCGDGVLRGTEACDDGVLGSTVNCESNCSGPKLGWTCSVISLVTTC